MRARRKLGPAALGVVCVVGASWIGACSTVLGIGDWPNLAEDGGGEGGGAGDAESLDDGGRGSGDSSPTESSTGRDGSKDKADGGEEGSEDGEATTTSDAKTAEAGPECVIGGTTYASGATNSSNACQSCQPGTNATDWSNVPAAGAGCTPPRAIAPLSTARVTSQRPTLRWVTTTSNVTDATVDLCMDRACSSPISSAHVTGTTFTPATALPVGVVYWRLHPSTVTTVTSPVWQFTVGHRSAAVDTSWGTTLDVNGDGYADVAVTDGTAAYVYLGGENGLSSTPATTLAGPDGAGFEWIASAGDVNGDGYADLVAGQIGALSGTGRAYVYLGSATGLATVPAATVTGPAGAGGYFGKSVASAGDVNGDGYADVVVGAWIVSASTGAAYVYLGSATGLAATPATTLSGTAEGAHFGFSVASAGDVNGDGYADVAIGAPATNSVSVYLGGATGIATTPTLTLTGPDTDAAFNGFGGSVATAGDVNGDGYADLVVGADEAGENNTGNAYIYLGSATGLSIAPAATLAPATSIEISFGNSVASVGDVNGDGFADVVIGGGLQAAGGAYVYLGSAAGLTLTVAATLTNPTVFANVFFGSSVSSAGDVMGNGFSDLVVGASTQSMTIASPATNVGNAYIYLGGSQGINPDTRATTLTGPADTEDGGTGDNSFGFQVFGATN